ELRAGEARDLVGSLPPRAPGTIDADAQPCARERGEAGTERLGLARTERDRGEDGCLCHGASLPPTVGCGQARFAGSSPRYPSSVRWKCRMRRSWWLKNSPRYPADRMPAWMPGRLATSWSSTSPPGMVASA